MQICVLDAEPSSGQIRLDRLSARHVLASYAFGVAVESTNQRAGPGSVVSRKPCLVSLAFARKLADPLIDRERSADRITGLFHWRPPKRLSFVTMASSAKRFAAVTVDAFTIFYFVKKSVKR